MTKQKKPYISPKVEFHSVGSDAYNRFHALLDEQMNQADEFPKTSHPVSKEESYTAEECGEV